MKTFKEIDFSSLKTLELDGGELVVESVETGRPSPFYQYNGALTRITITDRSNRYPYVDLDTHLAHLGDKVSLPILWIEVMPVRAEITCHSEIVDEVKEILEEHKLENISDKSWHNVFREEDVKTVNKYSIKQEVTTEALMKIGEGYECVKIRIQNIPLDKDNVFKLAGDAYRVRQDAYCGFPEGTEIKVYHWGKYFGTLKDVEQYTVETPLCEHAYRYFEVKFREDLDSVAAPDKGELAVLMYPNDIRAAIFKSAEAYEYELI